MGLAVAAAALCLVLRRDQPQMASLCAAAAGCILLLEALSNVVFLREQLERLARLAGLQEEALSLLLKTLGMSYLAELSAQTCEELGEKGIALKAQLAGKLAVFAVAAPLLLDLLETIVGLVP